jgi:hypothetical protein
LRDETIPACQIEDSPQDLDAFAFVLGAYSRFASHASMSEGVMVDNGRFPNRGRMRLLK